MSSKVNTPYFCSDILPLQQVTVPIWYSETSLNRTLCIPKTSLNWTCYQVLLSIFAVHTEPP